MKYLFKALSAFLILSAFSFAQIQQLAPSGGSFVASQYYYGGPGPSAPPPLRVSPGGGTNATGAGTLILSYGAVIVQNNSGRRIMPLATNAPITVDSGANQETVTPSAVSCSTPDINLTCSVTATFSFVHGGGVMIQSGTFGLQEAINDAFSSGGGTVRLDSLWTQLGGTEAIVRAAVVYPSVPIEDFRAGSVQYYNPGPTTASFIATPTTLTAVTALPSATPVGAYGTGTYFLCIAYVDIMGNEGACSASFSEAGLATGSFIFSAPAASTGAVGYTVYISLTAGSYAFAYQVPLTSSICTLTKIETVTPACAVANSTYGQSGSVATVTAITVNTSPLALQLGAASTTTDYVGNSNARTTYGYIPGGRIGLPQIVGSSLPFTAGPATVATTVPQVVGTLAVPAGFMNVVGKTVRVCGKLQLTGASGTIEQVQLWWDGAGSNAAGVPVKIADLSAAAGPNTAAAYNGSFCWQGKTSVSGAGVTAGSILGGYSLLNEYLASAPVGILVGGDKLTAAVGSLNLAGGSGFTSRIHVVQLHTTGTDVSPQLVDLTVEVI